MKTQSFETRWNDYYHMAWVKVFKNGSSKIRKRRPLRNLKQYGLLRQIMSLQIFKRLSSTNFTWFILEYLDPYLLFENFDIEQF